MKNLRQQFNKSQNYNWINLTEWKMEIFKKQIGSKT